MNRDSFKNKPTLFAASGLYLLAAMGLWAISLLGIDPAALIPGLSPEASGLILSLLYYVPFLLLPACLYAARRGNAAEKLRLNPISGWNMITASIVALLALTVAQNISTLWMILFQKLGFNVFAEPYVRPSDMTELTLSVIAAAIVAPIGEELLFRGALLSAWERRGRGPAILITAVLFAMLHGSVLGLPGEIYGGILLAQLVLWTDSIYAGLAFHSVYNAGGVMMNYLSSAVSDPTADALMQADIFTALGGWPVLLVLLLDVFLMTGLIRIFTRGMRMRYTFRRMLMLADETGKPATPKELIEREKVDPEPLSVQTMLVLIAGVVSALGMYILDIILMLGG